LRCAGALRQLQTKPRHVGQPEPAGRRRSTA
jgi:hypothetical protein